MMKRTEKNLAVVLAIFMCMLLSGCKSSDYKNAMDLYEKGDYVAAKDMFAALGDYKDSASKLDACDSILTQESVEERLKDLQSDLDDEFVTDLEVSCNVAENTALCTVTTTFKKEAVEELGLYNNTVPAIEELIMSMQSSIIDTLEENGLKDAALTTEVMTEDGTIIWKIEGKKLTYNRIQEIIDSKTPAPDDCDFRAGHWGDSMDEILQHETGSGEKFSDGMVVKNIQVNGISAEANYVLDDDDSLIMGVYEFTNSEYSDATYITNYNSLKESLTAKYGTPKSDRIIRLSSLAGYTDAAGALSLGLVQYLTVWETDRTTIKLAMKAEDYSSIKTYIFYVSNDYQSTPDTNNL